MNDRVPDRIGELRERLDTPEGWEWVRRAAWVVLSLAFLAFVVRGGSSPADPYLATAASSTERTLIPGFEEIAFTTTDPNGVMAEWCAMLADSNDLRAQGLMEQTDLGGYDGMVFRYDEPSTGAFWMRNTRIPLAVAFFDADGRFVSAQGMDPCPDEVVDDACPRYPAAAPYVHAVEVPRGGLGAVGIGAGSSISFPGRPCP